MLARIWFAVLLVVAGVNLARSAEVVVLPGTEPLAWEEDDLSTRMMDGLHTFIERKIADSVKTRGNLWQRDFSSPAAYEKSIEPNRERFKKMIGVVDQRVPVRLERIFDSSDSAVADTPSFRIDQIRWTVLDGVNGEGLLLEPKRDAVGYVVALPDADQTPEQIVGLEPSKGMTSQFARILVECGYIVFVPTIIDRTDEWSGHPDVAYTNQTHREWIYRQAYQMGRHVIGYEVQKVLALADWLQGRKDLSKPLLVAGYGEGGLLAFYAAAVDPRINGCVASGCFDPHAKPWEEPLYRNLFGFLRGFGDAEVASLISPRKLIVEYSEVPKAAPPKEAKSPRRGGAAAGQLLTPSYSAVAAEFNRIDSLHPDGYRSWHLVHDQGVVVDAMSFGALNALVGATASPQDALSRSCKDEKITDLRKDFDPRERQRRQVKELEEHVQRLVRGADHVRDQRFLSKIDTGPDGLKKFVEMAPAYRQEFWDEVLGRFDDPLLPMKPRSRKIYDRPKWTGYDVVLDVLPDVFAWGALLLPKDLMPGEKRPVVVCQHGRNGIPKDTIEGDHRAYHDYAAKLADRGFIVFAPHNPYRGEDRYRFLSRKANSVKASLFSFILAQHEQILNYLESLPQVDRQRIAFYGLSYGGETAVRVPPLLERYCLSICSADFNDWARKVASTDARYSFMFTIEWEMPYFNMGNTFNYAELAYLMLPRPFMVERGHADGVAPDEWVAYEYAKVRRLYDQLGLGDRTEIEFFNGPHTIHGVGTFDFLHRHLKWPKPE
jgi:dienelactone hydrolase